MERGVRSEGPRAWGALGGDRLEEESFHTQKFIKQVHNFFPGLSGLFPCKFSKVGSGGVDIQTVNAVQNQGEHPLGWRRQGSPEKSQTPLLSLGFLISITPTVVCFPRANLAPLSLCLHLPITLPSCAESPFHHPSLSPTSLTNIPLNLCFSFQSFPQHPMPGFHLPRSFSTRISRDTFFF